MATKPQFFPFTTFEPITALSSDITAIAAASVGLVWMKRIFRLAGITKIHPFICLATYYSQRLQTAFITIVKNHLPEQMLVVTTHLDFLYSEMRRYREFLTPPPFGHVNGGPNHHTLIYYIDIHLASVNFISVLKYSIRVSIPFFLLERQAT